MAAGMDACKDACMDAWMYAWMHVCMHRCIWTQFITTKKPSTDEIEVAILSIANCVENSENTKMFEDITTQASEVKVG